MNVDAVYRSTRLSTQARCELPRDATRALRKAERALAVWSENPDALGVIADALGQGLYRRFDAEQWIRALAWWDGDLLVSGASNLIRLRPATGEVVFQVEPNEAPFIAIARVGDELWGGGLFGAVHRIDPQTGAVGEQLIDLEGTVVTLTELGPREALVCGNARAGRLNADGTFTELASWREPESPDQVALTACGTLLAREGTRCEAWAPGAERGERLPSVRGFWAHPSDPRAIVLPTAGSAQLGPFGEHTETSPHAGVTQLTAAAWHPDGAQCVTGDHQGAVVVHTPGDYRERRFGLGAEVKRLACDPSGRWIAATVDADKGVYLIDLEQPSFDRPRAASKHYNMRFGALSADLRHLALSHENDVDLYTTAGQLLRTLKGGEYASLNLAFQGDRLYSAGNDAACRAWSFASGELVGEWRQPDVEVEDWQGRWENGVHVMSRNSSRMAFAVPGPGNELLLSGSPGGAVQLWPLAGGPPIGALPADPLGEGPRPDRRPAFEGGQWLDAKRFLAWTHQGIYVGNVDGEWLHRLRLDDARCTHAAAHGTVCASYHHGKRLAIWSLTDGSLTREVALPRLLSKLGFSTAGVLQLFLSDRDGREFARVSAEGELTLFPYLLKDKPEWVGWEPSGDFAWVAVPKQGFYRVPVGLTGCLESAGHAASWEELGLGVPQP